MPGQFSDFSLPPDFDNTVRLFPLPKLVMFPGVMQALHVFEPRYREMVADCLASDRLLTLAMLYEDQFNDDGDPKIAQTVCLGRIESEVQMEDGRYTLMLVGEKRATIKRELRTQLPYRMAEVEVFDEDLTVIDDQQGLRAKLVSTFRLLSEFNPAWDKTSIDSMLADDLPLCRLVDVTCYVAGLDPENQQRVLATFDLKTRTKLAIQLLQDQLEYVRQTLGTRRDFPPKFSLN